MFKLQYKIALLQFLVGCAIVLLGLTAYHQYSIKAVHQEAQDSLQNLSHKSAQQVDFVLQEKTAKIKALTGAPVVENLLLQSNAEYSLLSTQQRNNHIADLNRQWMETEDKNSPFIQAFLSNSVAQYFLNQFDLNPGEYGEIFLTNRYGALVASTEKLTTFAHGHKYWWTASYNNGLGRTFFDDRGFDASVEGYVLGIVVPVKKDGQIIGILKSNIRIQSVLDKIVNGLSTEHYRTLIVRDGGAVILQPGHDPLSAKVNSEIQIKLDDLQEGSLSFNDGTIPSFAGFSPILISQKTDQSSFGGNPKSIDHSQGNQGESWNVVVTESVAHALQLSQRASSYFYAMNFLVIFVLAAIALFIGRRIAAPLEGISKAAKLIGAGKFDVKLAVTRRDELGAVATAFNNMSENLTKTMATKEEYALEIEQRKQAEKALHDSEAKLTSIIRSAPIGIGQVTDRKIDFVNEQFAKMLGYSAQELLGKNSRVVYPSDEEFERVGQYKYEEIRRKGTGSIETIMQKKDGTLINVFLSSTALDQNDLSLGVTFTALDITDRKEAEQERLDLEGQLRQKYKMEAIGVMAGGMAHNFNNNLSIILGNVELSKLKMTANPEIDDYLSNAKIAVLRSRDLIQQILTYSRQNENDKTSIQLPFIIDETLKLLHSTMPTTINLQQQISSDSHHLTIDADASQVQECLVNLCNNAMYAMKEEGDLTIALDHVELQKQDIPIQYESRPGHYAKLSVQDTGSGISADTVDKIFDLFFTTKPVDEGTGVGLSTVQGIVTQHDGLIKVNSQLGEGTTFELYFPVAEQTQVPETTSANEDLPKGTECILFVDDDEMLAMLGDMMLKQMGYQVTMMTDSMEALKLFTANAERFDLVITDQTMPGLTGEHLIKEIKKIKPEIPTIICTGFSNKVDKEKAAELGASAFLMKPLDMPKLLQTVRRVLDENKNG